LSGNGGLTFTLITYSQDNQSGKVSLANKAMEKRVRKVQEKKRLKIIAVVGEDK